MQVSQGFTSNNIKFFDYLLTIGIINSQQHDSINASLKDAQEKHLLFQVSNIFATLTASDWFDLTCRIYKGWQKFNSQLRSTNSSQPISPPHKVNKSDLQHILQNNYDIKEISQQYEPKLNFSTTESAEAIRVETYPNPRDRQKKSHKFALPLKNLSNIKAEQTLGRLNSILTHVSNRNVFLNLKQYYFYHKYVQENTQISNYEEPQYMMLQRHQTPPRQEPFNRPSSATQNPHAEKLYFDYFERQAHLEIKREIKKFSELDDCTFVPQVNQNYVNENLINRLEIPVHERLSQTPQIPVDIILEKHEYRELKGVTFQPDISQSQNKTKWRGYAPESPESRKQEVVDRLYNDAQVKEQNRWLRGVYSKQQELAGCTFTPNINNSYQSRSRSKERKNSKPQQQPKIYERLYEDNEKKQRNLLQRELENKGKELEGCTFQPETTKNYRRKLSNEFDGMDVHDRLYERAKKPHAPQEKFNQSLQVMFELNTNHQAQLINRNKMHKSQSTISINPEEFIVLKENFMRDSVAKTPAYDRLYKEMGEKKQRASVLKAKVLKEEGVTFKPETNWSKRRNKSISMSGTQSRKSLGVYDTKFVEASEYPEDYYDEEK